MSKGGALDVQIGGQHYKGFKIQPVTFFHANKVEFLEGNIMKYAMRHASKNKAEDLKKSRHYCDLAIQLHYPEEWEKMQAEEAKKFEIAVQAEVKKRLDVMETLREIELDFTGETTETDALKEELKEEPMYEIELDTPGFDVNATNVHAPSVSEEFHKNHGRDAGFDVKKFVSPEPLIREEAPEVDWREDAPRCEEPPVKETNYIPGSHNFKAKRPKHESKQ